MKNKLVDLNNHLFTQLERLNDEDISPENLEKEIKRAEAITKVATQIIESSNISLRAAALVAEYGTSPDQAVYMITGQEPENRAKRIEGRKEK